MLCKGTIRHADYDANLGEVPSVPPINRLNQSEEDSIYPKPNRDDDNPTEQTHHEQTDDCALIEFHPLQLLSYGQAVASVTAIRVIASMR